MVDEVLAVKDEYGLELAYFNDDNLARDHDWLAEFCRLFKDEVGIQFCGSVRADSLTEDVVAMMAEAGCVFQNIALESAVPETQKLLRRGRVTNDDIANACEWFRRYGIKVRLQNMIGLPILGEHGPLDDALETLAFNQKVNPTDSWVAIFQPFRRTDLWTISLKRGFITEETECQTFFDNTVLTIPDAEKINRLAKWWHFCVDHNLSRKAVLELIDIPLTEEQKRLIREHRWQIAAKRLYEIG